MRVLVVGGNGFIGSHVVDVLLQEHAHVVVLGPHPERFRPPLPSVTYIRGRLGDRSRVEDVVSKGLDGVVHLASTTAPQTSNEDPVGDVENLRETLQLFQLCVKHKVGKVVFTSSGGTVYGIPNHLPVTEEHPTNPICSYGIVKLAIEKYLQCFQHLYGLQYVALRLANVYGIRQNPLSAHGAVSVFMRKMIRGEPLTVWGDGTVVRDFVEVRDVARLCSSALSSAACGVFNAGSGIGVSINDLLELTSKQLQVEPRVVWKSPRKLDVAAIVLDSEKAQRIFSWRPRVPLAEGLQELADWLRKEEIQTGTRLVC